jgi:hypothetical protein
MSFRGQRGKACGVLNSASGSRRLSERPCRVPGVCLVYDSPRKLLLAPTEGVIKWRLL